MITGGKIGNSGRTGPLPGKSRGLGMAATSPAGDLAPLALLALSPDSPLLGSSLARTACTCVERVRSDGNRALGDQAHLIGSGGDGGFHDGGDRLRFGDGSFDGGLDHFAGAIRVLGHLFFNQLQDFRRFAGDSDLDGVGELQAIDLGGCLDRAPEASWKRRKRGFFS